MTAALTPELALAYVRELSTDVRDGAVLDAQGRLLAGAAHLARLLPGGGAEAGDAGCILMERGARHAIVVECGPFALPEVIRTDLRAALASLDSAP